MQNDKLKFKISFFLLFFFGVFGLGKSSWAATINVVSQINGTPSCDNGTNHNGTESPELVPAFTAGNWTAGSGWSVSGGQLVYAGTGGGIMQPNPSIPPAQGTGYKYFISVSISTHASGTFTTQFGGVAGPSLDWVGFQDTWTYTATVKPSTNGNLIITPPVSNTPMKITAISIKLVHDDVQAALTGAPAHATVSVPAGTCTWTQTVAVPNDITFTGAGCTQTNGYVTASSTCSTTISCPGSGCLQAGGRDQITGFKFISTTAQANMVVFYGPDTRVYRNYFETNQTTVHGVYSESVDPLGEYARGLADHNYFHNANVVSWGGTLGLGASYKIPSLMWLQGPNDPEPYTNKIGDKHALYVEDNIFDADTFNDATDVNSGGRLVFRFNRVSNIGSTTGNGWWLAAHGKEFDQGQRGTQRWEAYGNLLYTPPGSPGYAYTVANYRGGTGMFWGNKVYGYWPVYEVELDNYRNMSPEYDSFTLCDGTDPKDQLVSPYACRDQVGYGQDASFWCDGTYTGLIPPLNTASCQSGTYGTWNQVKMPVYSWSNGPQDKCQNPEATGDACDHSLGFVERRDNIKTPVIAPDRDYFNYNSNCNSSGCSSGVGVGSFTSMPANCADYTGWWATDRGGNWNTKNSTANDGALYQCHPANNWTLYYTPLRYPHELNTDSASDTTPPAPPRGLNVQ